MHSNGLHNTHKNTACFDPFTPTLPFLFIGAPLLLFFSFPKAVLLLLLGCVCVCVFLKASWVYSSKRYFTNILYIAFYNIHII